MEPIDVAGSGAHELSYETPVEVVQKVRAKLANKMATPEETKEDLFYAAYKNRGGLTLWTNSPTYEGANTGNYRVVLTDMDGKEFYREDLKSSNPSSSDGRYTSYTSIAIVRLKERPTFPFNAYIINRLLNKRDEFIVGEMKDFPEEYKLQQIKELEKELEAKNDRKKIYSGTDDYDREKRAEYEIEIDSINKKIEYIKSLLKDEQAN